MTSLPTFFEVEVALVVVAPSIRRQSVPVALVEGDVSLPKLPTAFLKQRKTCLATAAELLARYTGLEARVDNKGWVPLIQTGVVDRVDEFRLTVVFATIVPETTPIHVPGAFWSEMQTMIGNGMHADHASILVQASGRL